MVMLWKILFSMILFYLIIYFVIPMMLWVDMLLRSGVAVEPICVLADGTASFIIYLFNNYAVVTDVIVTRPGIVKAHIIFCHCGS